jgi:hypothetical protein
MLGKTSIEGDTSNHSRTDEELAQVAPPVLCRATVLRVIDALGLWYVQVKEYRVYLR